jgi:hypothetical protein
MCSVVIAMIKVLLHHSFLFIAMTTRRSSSVLAMFTYKVKVKLKVTYSWPNV